VIIVLLVVLAMLSLILHLRPSVPLAGLAVLSSVLLMAWFQRDRRLLQGLRLGNAALSAANEQLSASNRYLQLLATTDPLTGLSNRAHLYQRMDYAIADARRDQSSWALLLLDLNRFKSVNDTLGHQYGDLLLQQVALRMGSTLRGSDLAARLGGDEFALLLPETGEAGASALASRLVQVLEKPFDIEGQILRVGASVGVAIFPDHGIDVHSLMRCVDVAMYHAKRTRQGYVLYAPERDDHGVDHVLTGELRQALVSGNLILHYQPKVQLATGRVVGVEALVRWRHPRRGLMVPDGFIALAEQTGLIAPLTAWVLDAALAQVHAWQQDGRALNVAVNLSVRDLDDARFPDRVALLLQHYRVPPQLLTLEITESTLMADPGPVLDVLRQLASIGVRIAIDDFGTGYSALGYLRQMPVNEVKIDKVFVLGLSTQHSASAAKDRMIVRAVTALAHALGLEVVAEGVENEEVCRVLGELRCNVVQGYQVSPPLPAEDLATWLVDRPLPALHPAVTALALEELSGWLASRRPQAGTAPELGAALSLASGSTGQGR
jgi:diguanylate cyclase (GGDEF)-like protein